MAAESPYLSVVASAQNRSDAHLARTRNFATALQTQASRFGLSAEIILVDWNPPAGREGLSVALADLADAAAPLRVVTVPPDIHARVANAGRIPAFRMIAKNVGIRRAKGEFVLATRADAIFSDELARFLAGCHLKPRRTYRVDRATVGLAPDATADPSGLPEAAAAEIAQIHHRTRPWNIEDSGNESQIPPWVETCGLFEKSSAAGLELFTAQPEIRHDALHVLHCGDFTLMHRDGWAEISGYAEFEMAGLHLDTLALHCAHRAGFLETWVAPPALCFVPAAAEPESIGPAFEFHELQPIMESMEKSGRTICFNDKARWGLAGIDLPESPGPHAPVPLAAPVSALLPEFDPLDLVRAAPADPASAATSASSPDARIAELEKQLDSHLEKIDYVNAERTKLHERLDFINADRARMHGELVKLRSEIAAERTKFRTERDQSAIRIAELATQVSDFADRLRSSRARLSAYQKTFGFLEKFGFFR